MVPEGETLDKASVAVSLVRLVPTYVVSPTASLEAPEVFRNNISEG